MALGERAPDKFEGRRGSILHAREYAGCLKDAPLQVRRTLMSIDIWTGEKLRSFRSLIEQWRAM